MAIIYDGESFVLENYVKFGKNSPYYRLPINEPFERHLIPEEGKRVQIFMKKSLYSIYDWQYIEHVEDLGSSMWHDFNKFEPYPKDYVQKYPLIHVAQHMRYFQKIVEIPTSRHHPLINFLLRAENILDGKLKGYRKFFDHYTATGRLRDMDNTIGLGKFERKTLGDDNLYYVDIEGCHFRIIDHFMGQKIPKDIHPVDYFTGGVHNKEEKKQELFKAIYSERFDFAHPYFTMLKRRYKKIPSPFDRKHNNFNYKIQEWEVLLMSMLIVQMSHFCDILTYHYDGVLVRVNDKKALTAKYNLPIPMKLVWEKI